MGREGGPISDMIWGGREGWRFDVPSPFFLHHAPNLRKWKIKLFSSQGNGEVGERIGTLASPWNALAPLL